MKHFNLDLIAMALLVIAGLNAGVNAVFSYNTIGKVLTNGDVSNVFYGLVGLAALYAIADRMGWVGDEA
ncbi:MAG: DUF378 domain-containing protein [Gaiellales bacterium]